MTLSDRTIKQRLDSGSLKICPLDMKDIQPCSVDVHLGSHFIVFPWWLGVLGKIWPGRFNLDPSIGDNLWFTRHVWLLPGEKLLLKPLEFALGSTAEWTSIPNDLAARIEGKSSLGRWGLVIHATAGFIDAGFKGEITVELFNMFPLPWVLRSGTKIGQLSFSQLSTEVDNPYGSKVLNSKYQNQTGATVSRMHLNYPEYQTLKDETEPWNTEKV